MKKNVVILGSTGLIGSETFNLIKRNKKNFRIKLLSTNCNFKKVYKQAKQLEVKNIIINDYKSYQEAKKIYKNENIKFYNSFDIIDKLFKKKEIYYTMISIVGLDGLDPSLKLIKFSHNIAIVNKEALICGWNLIYKKLKKFKTNFLPVDSEHFSLFSLINKNNVKLIDKIYITASGGPFLNYTNSEYKKITLNQALTHPNWLMGKKISIDSSTMMNKLFEVIEAKKIFNLKYNDINILIHPKSYIHAIIKFKNGLIKFLAHEPEMKIPIHNTIYHDCYRSLKTKKIDLKIMNNLNFKKINYKQFPVLRLLKKLPNNDSLYETVLITINDYFVSIFLKELINYQKLIYYINLYSQMKIFNKFKKIIPKNIDEIYKTRKYVSEILTNSDI